MLLHALGEGGGGGEASKSTLIPTGYLSSLVPNLTTMFAEMARPQTHTQKMRNNELQVRSASNLAILYNLYQKTGTSTEGSQDS